MFMDSLYFQAEMGNHFNRRTLGNPMISTTSSLVWADFMAATEFKSAQTEEHRASVSIKTIDGRKATNREEHYIDGHKLYRKLKEIPGLIEIKNMRHRATTEYLF
jgi:hypothetical protein